MSMSDLKAQFQTTPQSVTATAGVASTNVVDMGSTAFNVGAGEPVKVQTVITTTFTTGAGATALICDVESSVDDTDGNFSAISRIVIPIAQLVKGKVITQYCSPRYGDKCIRCKYYAVTGAFNAGQLRSQVVFDASEDKQYPDARTF